MNPPSALAGAMGRDRKPFTYTPGGLDLSEIKSSRMAARLMRNAMNEGVPEKPPQQIQSHPMSSTPIAVPNYNCMPVQVFPAFNLPANPKSLLKTRSNPSQTRDPPIQRAPPPQPQPQPQPSQFVNNAKVPGTLQYDTFNKNTPTHSQVNNNRPVAMFEYGSSTPANVYTPFNYGNDGYKPAFPEISYDAEYLRTPTKNTNVLNAVPTNECLKSGDCVENVIKPVLAKEERTVPSIDNNEYRGYFEDKYKYHENKETTLPFNENNIYQDYSENIFKPANEEITFPFTENNKYQEYSENNFRPDTENKLPTLPSTLIETRKQGQFGNIYESVTDSKENNLSFIEASNNQGLEENHTPLTENKETSVSLFETIDNHGSSNEIYNTASETSLPFIDQLNSENHFSSEIPSEIKNTEKLIETINNEVENNEILIDISKHTADFSTFAPETIVSKPIEDHTGPDIEKKEVKVVKKQVIKSENKVEEQNGSEDQNGHSEDQAVVKLPTKKSAAKTETKVEITKTTLPDGSVEEVKKTITKTTIDGRTEIKTKTETTIIPKDDEEEVEEEEEEEEEVEEENVEVENEQTQEKLKENGQENIITTEEKSETTTTSSKKVVVVQDEQEEEQKEEEVVEEEEIEEAEPVTFVIKQAIEKPVSPKEEIVVEESQEKDSEEVEEVKCEEVKEQEVVVEKKEEVQKPQLEENKEEEVKEEVEEEEEYEEAEEKEVEKVPEPVKVSEEPKKPEKDVETQKEQIVENLINEVKDESKTSEEDDNKQEQLQQITEEKQEVKVEKQEHKGEKQDVSEETYTIKVEKVDTAEQKVPLREPSVPLEKVEDVEIKPIGLGEFLTKTQTENTEIITNVTEKPTGLLTEINRVENIVTVNRTTKTLDRAYENITQQGIPTVKTYFTPHIDKISTSTQPARPYQPVYPPEPTTERRHSLLLERLSVERQMPSDIYQQSNNYQYSNQTVEQQRQWSQEPQAEVLTVSNVKPSQITNQQWYQQKENAIYNNVAPSPQPTQAAAPSWTQSKTQPQPVYQTQHQYQPPPQPQYQAPSQTQYQAPPQAPTPQPQYQPSYTENLQESSSNTYQNTYSTFTPKPTNWTTNTSALSPIPTIITPSQPSPYSTSYKESSESYQKSTQNYSSSSYVPPPWEQDSTYVAPPAPQDYYQPPPQTSSFSPAPNQGWKPKLPTSKFNKTTPTAYIPPKPNQSFVAPVTAEPPKVAGRKTYYSEYERRYISVPESTYIPGDNKFQPQPDPSPAYYYDNNEPAETVEPQWRRELREFTEKSQTETTTETNVNPPWQAETTYAKTPEPTTYIATPTWSQTVRPQSWRERSFESEFVSQEWPKTNTLGRGRPLSSYGKESVPQRTRGVSVDRYNPNSYQSPVAAEHPPVQTHTHIPPAPHATGYHNPNVPAYHARASAEPREQVSYQQPRNLREARASPFQSRSFKYLQWITGTED